MPMLTAAQILRIAPKALPHIVAAIVDNADRVFPRYGLSTLGRVQAFLSVADEESGGFTVLTENLNYTAARAHAVWQTIFPTVASAAPYAGKPEALADKVYGGRMGNTAPGDGWKYRGEGLPQITGHDNFAFLQRLTGLPLLDHPELAASDANMLECAVALFVHFPGILAACDAGNLHAVWALVGSGRADGPIINLAAHEAALAAVRAAVTQLGVPAPIPAPTPVPAPPSPAPAGSSLGRLAAAIAAAIARL